MGDRLHRPQPPQAGSGEESVCGEADDPTNSRGGRLRLPPALIATCSTLARPHHPHKVDRLLGATHVALLVRESDTPVGRSIAEPTWFDVACDTASCSAGDENPRRARHWCCADRAPQPCIRSIALRIAP